MNARAPKQKQKFERYEAARSPLAQRPTQRDLANLVGLKKAQLRALVMHKEKYIVRSQIESRGKIRNLAYPRGKLRTVHERLKIHCNKIKLPDYTLSPRKGRSQRDNAIQHLSRTQYFKFDLKQFYPSTTWSHIFQWASEVMGMPSDVARLFADIVTVDGRVAFGSPLTPVLTVLVHRAMFDRVDHECRKRGLIMSVWVDDVVISGQFVPGRLVDAVRDIIRSNGLKSHKLEYKTGSRRVLITGIPLAGDRIDAPRSLHDRTRDGYAALRLCAQPASFHQAADALLSTLGTLRYIVGPGSTLGRKTADRMAALRARRGRIPYTRQTPSDASAVVASGLKPESEVPF